MPAQDSKRWFQLLLLALAAMVGLFGRNALGPLQERISSDLALSDNQMAFLQGPALGIPLLIVLIPLGLAIDRHRRVPFLFGAVLLGVAGMGLTAIAPDFATLVVARGLAGLASPCTAIIAYSLLADLCPPAQRGRATMLVSLGETMGASGSFALGGLLSDFFSTSHGWRAAMLGMAALVAPIVVAMLFLNEPLRNRTTTRPPPLGTVWPELKRHRGVIATLVVGTTLVNVADGAALVWVNPMLIRNFHLTDAGAGAVMATALLFGGLIGPVVGGFAADLCQRSGGSRRVVLLMIVLALLSLPAGLFPLIPGISGASLALSAFLTIGITMTIVVTAALLVVVPSELRGLCVSLLLATGAIFGLGLAPLLVSLLSGPMGGERAIGNALAVVLALANIVGTGVFVLGLRFFPGAPSGAGGTVVT